MNPYPKTILPQPEMLADQLQLIARERESDIIEFNNLQNIFMRGRKVGKVPTGSADIAATDRIGDFNYSASTGYFYLCFDNAGTAEWRRVAFATW